MNDDMMNLRKRKLQLRSDTALLALAQDIPDTIRGQVQRPMQVGRPGRDNGKLLIVAVHEVGQKRVALVHAANALQT